MPTSKQSCAADNNNSKSRRRRLHKHNMSMLQQRSLRIDRHVPMSIAVLRIPLRVLQQQQLSDNHKYDRDHPNPVSNRTMCTRHMCSCPADHLALLLSMLHWLDWSQMQRSQLVSRWQLLSKWR